MASMVTIFTKIRNTILRFQSLGNTSISLWSIITYTAEGWADLDLDLLFNLIRGDHEPY